MIGCNHWLQHHYLSILLVHSSHWNVLSYSRLSHFENLLSWSGGRVTNWRTSHRHCQFFVSFHSRSCESPSLRPPVRSRPVRSRMAELGTISHGWIVSSAVKQLINICRFSMQIHMIWSGFLWLGCDPPTYRPTYSHVSWWDPDCQISCPSIVPSTRIVHNGQDTQAAEDLQVSVVSEREVRRGVGGDPNILLTSSLLYVPDAGRWQQWYLPIPRSPSVITATPTTSSSPSSLSQSSTDCTVEATGGNSSDDGAPAQARD